MGKKRDIDVSKEAGLIWRIANDVLRDVFQRTEYPDIIYPMVLLRRLECVLETETAAIGKEYKVGLEKMDGKVAAQFMKDQLLTRIGFHNGSGLTLRKLKAEGEKSIKTNFITYLNGFESRKQRDTDTDRVQEVIKNSGIRKHVDKLQSNDILYSLIEEFANVPLSPVTVSNIKMGYVFEELVRRFSEQNNSEAGEHYTPREVIDLMVQMLDLDERKLKNGELLTIYDPACGTGGMLSAAKEFIEDNVNDKAHVRLYGQEVNDKTWAICEADLMIKGEDAKVVHGDTLWQDGFENEKFDYMISNPPYGKSWAKIKGKVMAASKGRFDIGQPRTSDGQLLFTLHMLSKMKEADKGGSTIAIVHNGSPLFSGDAGGGESEIRGHIIANDLLETIVALPTQLFYNTGIATYIWILSNNKPARRKGKIQLINAVDFWKPMKRSLGDKRRQMTDADVQRIVQLHKAFEAGEHSKIYDLDDFAYRKVTIELHEVDAEGNPVMEIKEVNLAVSKVAENLQLTAKELTALTARTARPATGTYRVRPDAPLLEKHGCTATEIEVRKELDGTRLKLTALLPVPATTTDTEIIPYKDDMTAWLNREVERPWTYLSEKKGYEIPFTKEFYTYRPLRQMEQVLAELRALEQGDPANGLKGNRQLMHELGIEL